MCDYSLAGIPNRLATEGEQLMVYRFPTGALAVRGVTPRNPMTEVAISAKVESFRLGAFNLAKGPLDQFAALLQQPLAVVAVDPPTIRVYRSLLVRLSRPPASRPRRFRHVAPCLGLLHCQYRVVAVVALVGHDLSQGIQTDLWL